MLPVTISLGLINFNLLINSFFGTLVSDEAPAAIDKAFRIYQLPQGIFSVAIATVLFPTLARFAARGEYDDLRATMANGMRQILFVLLPAAAAILVLSEPMIRLVYQRGEFDPGADDARRDGALLVRLLAADQRPLPAPDAHLLQPPAALDADRDRRPSTWRHGARRRSPSTSLRRRRHRRLDRDRPTAASVVAQAVVLRRVLGGLEFGRLLSDRDPDHARRRRPRRGQLRDLGRARRALGRGLVGQIVSLGVGLAVGGLVYLGAAPAAPDRRARADHAPPAPPLDARPGRYLLGVAELGLLAGFAWLGAVAALAPASALRGRAGALATAVLALALLIWSPSCSAPSAASSRSVSGCRGGRGGGRCGWPGGVRPRRVGGIAAPPRRRAPLAVTPSATLVALADRPGRVRPLRLGADLLSTGMTGFDSTWYHGPFAAGFFQTGDTLGLHFIAPQFLAWFYPENAEIFHSVGMLAFGRTCLAAGQPRLVRGLPARRLVHRPALRSGPGRWPGRDRAARAGAGRPGGEARNDVVGIFFLLPPSRSL